MKTRYSKNLEVTLALVTHLAMTRKKSRTPSTLAKYLNLKKAGVQNVLDNFPGLFRKSRDEYVSKKGENYYTLQLRYARRWLDETANEEMEDPDPKEPLEPEYLSALINYISHQADQERTGMRQWLVIFASLIASLVAAAAAITVAVVNLNAS